MPWAEPTTLPPLRCASSHGQQGEHRCNATPFYEMDTSPSNLEEEEKQW